MLAAIIWQVWAFHRQVYAWTGRLYMHPKIHQSCLVGPAQPLRIEPDLAPIDWTAGSIANVHLKN
jgi:hypothetical protein